MIEQMKHPQIYDGDGDALMQKEHGDMGDRISLVPDALPSKTPDLTPRIRILWGQHLLEDLLAGRYCTLVCAVNPHDNSHGIISQLAELLPTSQWNQQSLTAHAKQFAGSDGRVRVLKYDMDVVEVLGILRPSQNAPMTLSVLSDAFRIVAEMIRRKPGRLPSASVSFLGARANKLIGPAGREPSFESILRAMYDAGYSGDVYPPPAMWQAGDVGVFARYPFPPSLERIRGGGF
jgi:hypothetical protein